MGADLRKIVRTVDVENQEQTNKQEDSGVPL
jgi:hypothetical protein